MQCSRPWLAAVIVEFPQFVGVLLDLGEIQEVAESAASAALHADAKADLGRIKVLLADDCIDFTGSVFGHVDRHRLLPFSSNSFTNGGIATGFKVGQWAWPTSASSSLPFFLL